MQRFVPALVLAAAMLAGCGPQVQAPTDPGVCWHMVRTKQGQYKFFKLSVNQPSMEYCAGNLEALREKFLSMGGSNSTVMGDYQGEFIFAKPDGIYVSSTLNGTPYLALVKTGDGRLAPPGAMPSP